MGPGGAGGRHGEVRSLGTGHDGDHAGRHVADDGGDEKRRDSFGTAAIEFLGLGFQQEQAAQATARRDPHATAVGVVNRQGCVLHGHFGGGDRIGDIGLGTLGVFFIHEIKGVEPLDLGSNFGFEFTGVEPRNGSDA